MADGVVDRHDTLSVELAQRHMERPLSGREGAETVKGEIGTLADPHAGVTDEQQRVADDIVAAQEFLLNEPILFGKSTDEETEPRAEEHRRDETDEAERVFREAKLTPPSHGVARGHAESGWL